MRFGAGRGDPLIRCALPRRGTRSIPGPWRDLTPAQVLDRQYTHCMSGLLVAVSILPLSPCNLPLDVIGMLLQIGLCLGWHCHGLLQWCDGVEERDDDTTCSVCHSIVLFCGGRWVSPLVRCCLLHVCDSVVDVGIQRQSSYQTEVCTTRSGEHQEVFESQH